MTPPRPPTMATVARAAPAAGPWDAPAYCGARGAIYAVQKAPPGAPPAFTVLRIDPTARTAEPVRGPYKTPTAAHREARKCATRD